MKSVESPSSSRRFLPYFPAPNPATPAIVLLALSLFLVLTIFMPFDVVSCWLPWSFASEGNAPWRIYLARADCNYPPVMLYLLTAQEAVRKMVGWGQGHGALLFMLKVPQILAHIGGATACYFGLRRSFGERYARQACLAYALSAAIFVNAALWGQADSLLALTMVATILLLMNGKQVTAGIVFGLALCVKLQAIVIAPVVLLYALRRFGWKPSLCAAGAGVATIIALAVPFLLAGAGSRLLAAYTDSAGYYPYTTLNAFNLWGAVNYVTHVVLHLPDQSALKDSTALLGPLSARHIGLILFAGALGALLVKLYRVTTPRMLAWTAALSAFSFFLLCTQMHERYGVPAAALLALVAPESLLALLICFGINLCAGWNQWVVLLGNWQMHHPLGSALKAQLALMYTWLLWVSLANCTLFGAALWYLLRGTAPNREEATCPLSKA